MEIIQLRTVIEIHKSGSLSRAGMRLNMAQSIVSRYLAAFEKECGGRIFYRNGRGVEPTELGERILPEIESIMEAMQRVKVFSETAADGIAGDVRILVSSAVGKSFVAKLFTEVKKDYPSIRLQFSEAYSCEIDSAFEEGSADVAVLLRNGTAIGSRDEPICQFDTYLVGLPDDPFLARDEILFVELEGLPLLMPSEPSLARFAIGNIAASKGIHLSFVAEANSPSSTQALLEAGAGYLISPVGCGSAADTGHIGVLIGQGRLRGARLCEPEFKRTLVVASNSSKLKRVDVVRKTAIRVLQDLIRANGQEADGCSASSNDGDFSQGLAQSCQAEKV